ncbi:MAG: hypothetical protein WC887_01420 [Candidatus Paceibacterota bacterium]|jgi:hypothetical protein
MDEILIEEKKYVSSKRAAKMTGYAKDYVGQLCREGRVPARLVGRSWYVLEAAIQDHRFGATEESEKVPKIEKTPMKVVEIQSTWESPRYEAASEELLPSMNRVKEAESPVVDTEDASQRIQDSWKAWFDRVESTDTPVGEGVSVGDVIKVSEEQIEVVESEEIKETPYEEIGETSVSVPIRVSRSLYRPLPEEFLPRSVAKSLPQNELPTRRRGSGGLVKTIQMAGSVLAIVVAAMAVIASGYLDDYILSNSQARIIAGVILYNK